MRARNIINVCAAFIFVITTATAVSAQTGAPTVTRPTSSAVSPNLSDLPTAHWAQGQNLKMVPAPKPLPPRGAGPGGTSPHDGALQHEEGPHLPVDSKTKFGGIGASGYIPPDPNIAVGKNDTVTGVGYVVQLVNSQFAVFDKTGKLITGPVSLSSLWSSLPGGGGCASNNAGDPVVQYDASAANGEGRWLVTQLGSTSGPTYSECIAVSQTKNPSGAYYLYSYPFGNNLNDYPKFGVWPTASNSAYLASYNLFANGQTFTGAQLCAYNRDALLKGDTLPPAICFPVADGNFLPSDLDGPTPPADGTPGVFLNFQTASTLRQYQFTPNFAAPLTTILNGPIDIPVASFAQACNGGTCIVQPNSNKLDSLGDRLMYRLAYRMFSDHASMVVNHSVTAGSSVGVRWYELQAPLATPTQFSLYQQGTFAPDAAYRWMGSAAMDGAGNIAIGYSKSSSSVYPSIAITSRTPAMPLGTMGTETILQAGAGAQTTYNRWGDYTALRIDPSDDTTFWYTNEYYTKNSPFFNFNWSTAIASFTAGGSTSAPDFALSPPSNSLTVQRGANGSTTVTVTAVNGSSSVNLSVSGLPPRTSASFTPNPVTATANSTLKITVNRNAAIGTYPLTITGSNSSTTHTTQLSLTVQ